MRFVLPLFSSLLYGQSVTVDVSFKMTELERIDRPLAGVPVRLVLGEVADWQGPNAGHRFVTGPDGAASFSVEGVVDRRWKMVPYAMTGLGFPKRSDHIMIAAELEQLSPQLAGNIAICSGCTPWTSIAIRLISARLRASSRFTLVTRRGASRGGGNGANKEI